MTYHVGDPNHDAIHNDHATQIDGLQTSLANKSDVNHGHGQASVTNLDSDLATINGRLDSLEVSTNRGVLVLGPADPVPAGTPAGTVILRTT